MEESWGLILIKYLVIENEFVMICEDCFCFLFSMWRFMSLIVNVEGW